MAPRHHQSIPSSMIATVNWHFFLLSSVYCVANSYSLLARSQTTVNVTHFSADESLAASLWPSPLEQKPLAQCLLVKGWGALHPANALTPPGDLPSKLTVLKQAEVAGDAFTPTLPVNGRFSWVWNNSLSATVDRKCNISIPSRRLSELCKYGKAKRENEIETAQLLMRVSACRSSNGPLGDSTTTEKFSSVGLNLPFTPQEVWLDNDNIYLHLIGQKGRQSWELSCLLFWPAVHLNINRLFPSLSTVSAHFIAITNRYFYLPWI